MNARAISAIVRKDLRVVMQTKGVMIPLIIVPIVMLVVMPGLAALLPSFSATPGDPLGDMREFLAMVPAELRAELAVYNELQQIVVLAVLYFLAPMYLIVPLMVASVIAADSFAGEKERKTLEALLYTPTSDRELFVGKMLSAWLPAVAVAWIGFVFYGLVANIAGWPVMGQIFFPNLTWIVLALWVAPAVAGLGLGVTVVVSARAQSFQEAYQLGGVVVLPILFLVIGQATGVMYFSLGLVLLLGLVVWAADLLILSYGSKAFSRGQIIARI
jgi:ABC-2 type transport system permease protein